MKLSTHRAVRASLFATASMMLWSGATFAQAATNDPAPAAPTETADDAASSAAVGEVVVTVAKETRSAVALGGEEIQKLLPGVNPLKAIETLPGVSYQTADPWGNNEQNITLFVHGFSAQQLGYTLDGVPLGDQQYGNYNGLSPQRAVTSENVGKVILSSGAGSLATASTSNLGGAIETFSSDPRRDAGINLQQTLGSDDATRTFVRWDSGEFSPGTRAYLSYLHQDQRAWDFDGHQRGYQLNGKFVHEDEKGKFTLYGDFSDKVEPNEDSIVHPNSGSTTTQANADVGVPYTRPFLYPDLPAALAYLNASGAPPASAGNNFSNYHSAAQRTDFLGYAKYDYNISSTMDWSNQVYFHHDDGRGIVAGPINQAGLPALFAVYYPTLSASQTSAIFGGTGYAVRTTEYTINRGGYISNIDWTLGDHQIEFGQWYEHNSSSTHRVWYPFAASSTDLSPYDVPTQQNFTQYASQIENNVVQFHIQDQWRIMPNLLLQGGFKSSLQYAKGTVPIQQKNLPTNLNPTLLPTGQINTTEWFLPQLGAVWDATKDEQVFVNIQKNLRQFVTYGAGGLSPWSLGSQAAFDLFKKTAKPETAITYELGLRSHHDLDLGPVSGFEVQTSVYHVDFSNRLLQISATPIISSLVSGAAILANVGAVKTDGVDVAGTLHLGPIFSLYDALSYNRSIYQDDYTTGAAATVIHTAGKSVPDSPNWLNKFVASANWGPFEGQLTGDYVGKRFATYTNDLHVKSYFLMGLQVAYKPQVPDHFLVKAPKISINVTNLANKKGDYQVIVGQPSGTYNTYPIPPRMAFVTLSGTF